MNSTTHGAFAHGVEGTRMMICIKRLHWYKKDGFFMFRAPTGIWSVCNSVYISVYIRSDIILGNDMDDVDDVRVWSGDTML